MHRIPGPQVLLLVLAAAVVGGVTGTGCSPAAQPAAEADSAEAGDPTASGDAAARDDGEVRVYVADRYESVRRLDPGTLETVEILDVGLRPHGLIVSPDRRTLYVTVETTDELVAVDVATHEILGRVEVGPVPNEPTISGDGRHVFVPSRGGDRCAVVDTETLEVVEWLPAGEAQHNAYTSADGRFVYVTSMGDNLISVIDPESLEILHRIPVGGVPRPVALTADNETAYVALSGLTGFITLDLTRSPDEAVVDRVELDIPPDTPPPPLDTYTHGLLLTPDERELWMAAYATDVVHAFTVPELTRFAEIEVPGGPHWFALHPDGEPLYVTLEDTGKVAAIHRGLRQVLRVADVGQGPTRIIAFRTPAGAGDTPSTASDPAAARDVAH